ncbi:hypothetical protein Tco_1214991 [Tanacetum coccineum]
MISVGQTWVSRWKVVIKDMERIVDLKGADEPLSFLSIQETKDEKSRTWRSSAFGGNTNFVAIVSQSLRSKTVSLISTPWIRWELEAPISKDEIRRAVWDCGENKSPGPEILP